jgi:predicted RNase H-like nuclease (RuvC/YqgF family)
MRFDRGPPRHEDARAVVCDSGSKETIMIRVGHIVIGATGLLLAGCVSVKAPERIDIGGGGPEPVDSSRVPHPATLDEAQAELNKAYRYVGHLEQENRRLESKSERYKRERDRSEQKLEDCEDRLEHYRD